MDEWFDQVIVEALERKVRDIHFTAGSSVRYRIGHELEFSNIHNNILSMQDVNSLLKQLLSDKQMKKLEEQQSILVSVNQEKIGRSRMAVSKQTGLILVTGAPKSGKSTTCSSMIDRINKDVIRLMKRQISEALKAIICQRPVKLKKEDQSNNSIYLFEILINNNAIKRLIQEDKLTQLYDVMDTYGSMGMQSFNEHIAKMVIDGKLDKESAFQLSSDSKKLTELLNRGRYAKS